MASDLVSSELIRAQKVPNMLITCWTARNLQAFRVTSSPEVHEIAGKYREKPLPPRKSCDISVTPDSPKQPRGLSKQILKNQALEVVDRLNLYKDRVQEKLEKQRIAKEREETKDCSFAPKLTSKQYQTQKRVPLSHYPQALIAQSPSKPPLEVPNSDFHPTLDQHSMELTHSRNPANVFTALYTTTCATITEPPESPSFRPAINPKSSSLVRSLPVAELLYQDACRRREKGTGKQGNWKREVNQVSEEMVRKRFGREFWAALEELFEEKRDSLTLAEMSRFLVRLRFMEGKAKEGRELFAFLATSQRVDVNSLYLCLCEILGLAQQSFQHSAEGVRSLFRQLYVNRLRLPASTKAIPKEEIALTGLRTEDYIYRRKQLQFPFKSPIKSPSFYDSKGVFSNTALL